MDDVTSLSPSSGQARLVVSDSIETTVLLGRAIGMSMRVGDVALLAGELGAGKTSMVHGMAAGVGSEVGARSPTFVLVNEYRGRIRLSHADLYRIESAAEARELALYEAAQDGALAVEWPERAPGEIPPDALLVRIEVDPATERRTITIEPRGRRSSRLASQAMAVFDVMESAIP